MCLFYRQRRAGNQTQRYREWEISRACIHSWTVRDIERETGNEREMRRERQGVRERQAVRERHRERQGLFLSVQ